MISFRNNLHKYLGKYSKLFERKKSPTAKKFHKPAFTQAIIHSISLVRRHSTIYHHQLTLSQTIMIPL